MKATEITKGMVIIFESSGYKREFTIEKVTDKRISWYTGFEHKSGYGVNTMKMVWCSIKQFQTGLDNGTYKIK